MTLWIDGRPYASEGWVEGLLSGLAPFETCRILDGRLPLERAHRARLAKACLVLGLPDPRDLWDQHVPAAAAASGDGVLRVAASPEGPTHAPSGELHLLIQHRPLTTPGQVRAAVAPWRHPGPQRLKVPSPVHRAAGAWARTRGLFDALLADRDGRIVEGSRTNLLWVRDDQLHSVPASAGALPGLGQAHILAAAARLERSARLARPTLADLEDADEAYLCNAVHLLAPLESIGGAALGSGPVGRELLDAVKLD